MIKVFALKPFTGNPADGIDNVNLAIFSRISDRDLMFWAETAESIKEQGSIKKIHLKFSSRPLRFLEKVIIMRRLRPDYLFGNGAVFDIPFALLKPWRTKYVIDWHTLLLKNEGYWRVKTPWFIRSFIFNRADLVIAVSEFAASSVRKYFPAKKIAAIINGVDSEFFNPARKNFNYLREKYGLDFGKPVVAFVGTLQPRKRPDLVIEVAKELKEMNFVFVGKDFVPWRYGEKIKQLPNARWVPIMPREDVATLLASSEVFIFPSLNETCAAVIVEAMASGVPVLASESGGNGEMVINEKSGFLIDPKEKKEKEMFIEKLRLFLRDKSLRGTMGEAARQRTADYFSWESVATRYKKFFEQDAGS